jgi:hypothetical protein
MRRVSSVPPVGRGMLTVWTGVSEGTPTRDLKVIIGREKS